MPALALLAPLASGHITSDMSSAAAKAETLKAELPRMLAEHKRIVDALRQLMQAATEEQQPGCARFAQKLIAHAQGEEEILYPAAILVGEYLKARLAKP